MLYHESAYLNTSFKQKIAAETAHYFFSYTNPFFFFWLKKIILNISKISFGKSWTYFSLDMLVHQDTES